MISLNHYYCVALKSNFKVAHAIRNVLCLYVINLFGVWWQVWTIEYIDKQTKGPPIQTNIHFTCKSVAPQD